MIKEKNGITDITSSEGRLFNYTTICKILHFEHSLHKNKVFAKYGLQVQSKSLSSFERKLNVMQKLGLVEILGDKCILDSSGKVLNQIVNRIDFLETDAKAFYFIIFFQSVARKQLGLLLDIINLQQGLTKKEIMIQYFSNPIIQKLWDTAKENVDSLKHTNVIPSMLNNKFTCMAYWLNDINAIDIKKGKFYTKIPKYITASFFTNDINNIYENTSKIYFGDCQTFTINEYYELLKKLVIDAHNIFSIKRSGISDLQAIRKFVCLQLLSKKIILEENNFLDQIKIMINDGIIRSIMIGRDGQPKNLTL